MANPNPPVLMAEHIERDPSLATEANLEVLLELVLEVCVNEGRDMGGYDYNLQSYYEKLYSVAPNGPAFEAIKAIAKSNPGALTASTSNQLRIQMMASSSLDSQVTTSTLHSETSYDSDVENVQRAERARARILKEVEDLFGGDSS